MRPDTTAVFGLPVGVGVGVGGRIFEQKSEPVGVGVGQ